MFTTALALFVGLIFAAEPIYYSSDLHRFPSEQQALAGYQAACECLREVENDYPLWAYRVPGWYAAKKEWERRRDVWQRLVWAHEHSSYRQHHLDELRRMIGDEAYWGGVIP